MAHIVEAVSSEAQRAREIWEHSEVQHDPQAIIEEEIVDLNITLQMDEYIFEMLSMVSWIPIRHCNR